MNRAMRWALLAVLASLALTLYLYILIAHWLALLSAAKGPAPEPSLEAGKPG